MNERSSASQNQLIAYVFWQWKQDQVAAKDYENRLRDFHEALRADPAPGLIRSLCVRLSNAPWANEGGDSYEDWYLVDNFESLGLLNEAAVTASRLVPHDAVAPLAAGGAGGVYGLRRGAPLGAPRYSYWFSKPSGMRYPDLFDEIDPHVDRVNGALWARVMGLGIAREFCLHTPAPLQLPGKFNAQEFPLSIVTRS